MAKVRETAGGLQKPPAGKGKKWFFFLLGILLILFFVFIVAPLVNRVPSIGQAHDIIREEGIEAGAFWYVDVEKVSESASFIRNTRDYTPGKGNHSQNE